jgi:hypothetical protein
MYYSDFDQADTQQNLKRADEIFSQANIKITQGKYEAWDQDKTFRKTEGRYTADRFDRDAQHRVIPGTNIRNITTGQDSKHLTAYFTKQFYPEGPIAGMAMLSSYGSPPYPAVFVCNALKGITLSTRSGTYSP